MAADPRTEQEIPFPWHLGVYDAHCHPTDTMSSIASIPSMMTRCLTVMATRFQDQELVSQISDKHSIRSFEPEHWPREECIVPCFGWHPWFSHQMYVSENEEEDEHESKNLVGEDKLKHYQDVLRPSRKDLSDEDHRVFRSLPDPMPFSTFISQTREYLKKYPYALVGEIGLDRSFRIPDPSESPENRDERLTPGGREGKRLTPFRVDLAHQKKIVKKQLQLAAEMNRAVSMHGVQAHGIVFEVIKELYQGHEKKVLSKREKKKRGPNHPSVPVDEDEIKESKEKSLSYPPRICLHSYSGNPSSFKQYLDPAIPVEIFASFSTAINVSEDLDGETPKEFEDMIMTIPDHMLLVESDLHVAGERMDTYMEDIVRKICKIKGWGLEEGVKRLGENWRRFVFG